ncbi:anthrone oxygenase family protein [Streptomyces sp. NPDC048577]|uniref:anthrone oxygenase family protein n=1 Tax=Streptomyces sp. NPDC048577 TaxID=3157209 RepID=UPI003434C338
MADTDGGGGAVLVAATGTTGLVAGVWLAYVCSVMPALGRSDDRVFVEVMRNINDVIQNPVFLTPFFGALLLTAVAAWRSRGTRRRGWTLAALVLYGAVFLITSAVGVPLNDALAAAGDPVRARADFETPWVAWNLVRAVLTTAAFGCLLGAFVARGDERTEPARAP